ncbi:MAG: hypothetical protein ACHQ1G_08205, partial [Planctomycetota bacterium]
LFAIVAAESLLLAGGLAAYASGALDGLRRRPPPVQVFKPPISSARIGDLVRYEKRDRATGKVLGYLEYEVKLVFIADGTTTGPEIVLVIKDTDAAGATRDRTMRILPRALMHGFLPPRFEDEDDYPAGERPVVSRISTATFPLRDLPGRPHVRGFLVEAVVPRRSLTEVAERYWMTDEVPVFGVARWERGDEVLVYHHGERPTRK